MHTPLTRLLESKGREVLKIDPEASVYDAVKRMSEHEVGALMVCSENDAPVGIITERDIRDTILHDQDAHSTKVRDGMSRDLISVDSAASVETCMNIMTERRVRHLPIIEQNRLEGIISIGDVVKYLCTERGQMIENLEKYITGSM